MHACTPEVEVWVDIASDLLVALGMNNLLELPCDEVVEGVNVLLDKASDLQESRQQLIFVLQLLDWLC